MNYPFLFGIIAGQCAIIALFFLKFWSKSRDRLFLLFSISFAILALERVGLALYGSVDEPRSLIYVLRLIAFGVIAYAVIDKNKRS